MSGEPNLNLSIEEVVDARVREAVEAESRRQRGVLRAAIEAASKRHDTDGWRALRTCYDGLWPSKPESPPAAAEPVTVEKVLANEKRVKALAGGYVVYWPDVEADLIRLVREQARRDVDVILRLTQADGRPIMNREWIARKVSEAAGLDA